MKLLITIITVLLTASLASAGLLYPDYDHDGTPLDVNAPGLGALIIIQPWTHYEVNWNDNWGNTAPGVNGDFDFTDAQAEIDYTTSGIVTMTNRLSSNHNLIGLNGVWLDVGQSLSFTATPGSALDLQMYDPGTLATFHTGFVNPDGSVVHAQVLEFSIDPHSPTPEPGTLVAGIALIVAGLAVRRARKA